MKVNEKLGVSTERAHELIKRVKEEAHELEEPTVSALIERVIINADMSEAERHYMCFYIGYILGHGEDILEKANNNEGHQSNN